MAINDSPACGYHYGYVLLLLRAYTKGFGYTVAATYYKMHEGIWGFRTSKDFSLKLTAASLNCDVFLVFGQNMSEYTCCVEQTNSFMLAPSFALV